MGLDSQMLKVVEMLEDKPFKYEYLHPIDAIERAIFYGIAQASSPMEQFIQGRFRSVKIVTLTSKYERPVRAG